MFKLPFTTTHKNHRSTKPAAKLTPEEQSAQAKREAENDAEIIQLKQHLNDATRRAKLAQLSTTEKEKSK